MKIIYAFLQRLFSNPAPGFVKARNIAAVTAVIAGALVTAPIGLPTSAITALGYVAATAGAVAGTAQLTKDTE